MREPLQDGAKWYCGGMEWGSFGKEMETLCGRMSWRPDVIVGVVRGGVIPAVVFSNKCGTRKFYVIKVSHVGEGRRIKREFAPDVSGKKVLLVEDMIKTGKSLAAAKEYLEGKGAEVKTACLYTMPHSVIRPDFSLREVREEVQFPWE